MDTSYVPYRWVTTGTPLKRHLKQKTSKKYSVSLLCRNTTESSPQIRLYDVEFYSRREIMKLSHVPSSRGPRCLAETPSPFILQSRARHCQGSAPLLPPPTFSLQIGPSGSQVWNLLMPQVGSAGAKGQMNNECLSVSTQLSKSTLGEIFPNHVPEGVRGSGSGPA